MYLKYTWYEKPVIPLSYYIINHICHIAIKYCL